MAVFAITGVLEDASSPAAGVTRAVPFVQDLEMARGEDATILLTVIKQDRTPANLSGGSLLFTIRRLSSDVAPKVSRAGVITDAAAGTGTFTLVQADTILLPEEVTFRFDVWYTDALGARWQVVPDSEWFVMPIVSLPDDEVTVPAAVTPLALGPSWLSLSSDDMRQTDGSTDELVAFEIAGPFDLVTAALANLFAHLSAIAWVSGGEGTIRVRVGGTADEADGIVILTSDPIVGTTEAISSEEATVVKPAGTQLVKVTIQNDTDGEITMLRGMTLMARGAT
jgi:hypothetical protein